MRRRAVLSGLLLIAALAPVRAQEWPSRNVTVIVPIPAGVTSDIVARIIFEQVGKQLGHTFVVENRVGAGGHRRQHRRQGRAGWSYHAGLWLDRSRERALYEAALRHAE